MNVTIIGAGEVGFHLARVLTRDKHEVVLVDHDTSQIARAEDALDVQCLAGHGTSISVLEEARVPEADLLVTATNDDELNMLAAFLGKALGAKRTMVRINNPERLGRRREEVRQIFKWDHLLIPRELAAAEIVKLVRDPQAVAVEEFADGAVQARRITFTKDSPWLGKPLKKLKIPKGTLVAAIFHEDSISIPSGESTIAAHDQVMVVGTREGVEEFENFTGAEVEKPRQVVLIGGGDMGFAVARGLQRLRIRAKLVESDRKRAQELAEKLPRITILHGDGTDLNLLKELNVDDADAFIATCKEDEKNLMSCQLAKNMGAKKAIALVKKPDYVPLYQQVGIDVAISPRLLAANRVLELLNESMRNIAVIAEGTAEVVEMKAGDQSPITREPLKDLDFPRGAIIGAVLRKGKVIIPHGDTMIEPGDAVIVFTFLSAIPELEKFFEQG